MLKYKDRKIFGKYIEEKIRYSNAEEKVIPMVGYVYR